MAKSKQSKNRFEITASNVKKNVKNLEKVTEIEKPGKKEAKDSKILKDFSKQAPSSKKTPQSGKKTQEIKGGFENEYKKLKIQLESTRHENSELLADLEQVRMESRNLRSKLIGLGVDISSLRADEIEDDSPEESETKENIRLLEWRLKTLYTDLKGKETRKQLFLHYKGGTGKTCISVSYAYKLADLGFKVLMVDIDPLGHLTEIFKVENVDLKESLYDVLIHGKDITNAIWNTRVPNLHIVPSNLSLSAIELPLSSMPMPGERLRMALARIEENYDFIIIDSAPNVGFLSLNAILASKDLFIPVLADYLSYHGLKVLFEVISSIEKDFSFAFDNISVFLNRFNEFNDVCFTTKRALETHYSDFLLKTVIRESQDIASAMSLGQPIFEVSKTSRGVEDLLKFIFEVLFYIGG